jgi:hypothetical protein
MADSIHQIRPLPSLLRSGALLMVLVGLVWLVGMSATPLTLSESVLYHAQPVGEIRGSQTVGQTFVAPYDGLTQIDVYLADYGRVNTGVVTFKLKHHPQDIEALVIEAFPANSVGGEGFYPLKFSPVSGSRGQPFYLELSAPSASSGNAITAYIRPQTTYSLGEAYVDGRPMPGDLAFVAHFQVGLWERIRLWFNQVTTCKPGPFGQWLLYPVLGLVGLSLWAVLFRMVEVTWPLAREDGVGRGR